MVQIVKRKTVRKKKTTTQTPPKQTANKVNNFSTPAPIKKHTTPRQKYRDLSTRDMKNLLIRKFGLQCWGCDFIAPREEYLQVDHIDPKSLGGSNGLDNRALLCAPCNSLKSNTKTIIGLRLENLRKGHYKSDPHPIDVVKARSWCRRYMKGEL